MKDLIHLLLVPDPEKRPGVDKVMEILEKWETNEPILLSDEAFEIKGKMNWGLLHKGKQQL